MVSNTLLQNAIVELQVIDLFVRIMESTEYIDVKVSEKEREKRCGKKDQLIEIRWNAV